MVARFEEQKDHRQLLEALAGLKNLNWRLELVGDGPLRQAMEHLARSLGIEGRVEFSGAVDDVADRALQEAIPPRL